MDATYTDNGYQIAGGATEDWWPTDGAHLLRGAHVVIRTGSFTGTVVFSGELGDGIATGTLGCTSAISTGTDNRTYYFQISMKSAQVNYNQVDVGVYPNNSDLSVDIPYAHTGGAGTFTLTITPSFASSIRMVNVLQAALYTVYRHNGGLSSQLFAVQYDDNNTTTNQYTTPYVYINKNGSSKKFEISHELGHRFDRLAMGDTGKILTVSYADDDPNCPSPETNSHLMGSREYQAASLKEGHAHFFSADVWNDHTEDDCVFRYWKDEFGLGIPTVDCEAADAQYPLAFMEANCGASWSGKGVDVDWLRTFWDVHTNGTGQAVTIPTMVDWMYDATAWGNTSGYSELDAQANVVGGTLNSNWNSAASENGVDHP
jgi:hypothetical protein